MNATRRLALLGALYAFPLAAAILLVDSLSYRVVDGLWTAGILAFPVAATVIQARQARLALRQRSALFGPVVRAALPFLAGATVVLFVAFVPLGRALGTFDIVEGTSFPGELFFLLLEAAAAIWMLISATAVSSVALVARRVIRR